MTLSDLTSKERFEELFTTVLANPLEDMGFTRRGKSLYRQGQLETFALIRLGGRLSSAGQISHIICFRHSFLREKTELTVPTQAPPYAEHYPFRFEPELLSRTGPSDWGFVPDRHMRMNYGKFAFCTASEEEVIAHLTQILLEIRDRWIGWGQSLTPQEALSQLKPYREEWWIARIWCEDYENYLSGL